MTREQFIAMARSYIGTPFHHQGRLPQVGLDCAGVIVCAARDCGYDVSDVAGYGRTPANGLLEQSVLAHCEKIAPDSAKDGDIMLFRFLREPQHLAVHDNGMLIHAYEAVGKVVENGFDETWRKRLVGCYRLRGIE